VGKNEHLVEGTRASLAGWRRERGCQQPNRSWVNRTLNQGSFALIKLGMNTMRTIQILATFGLTALATAQIAQAGLIGAQVTYDYFFPFPLPIAIVFSLPTQTIQPCRA
jgi:hypothetical protein